MVAVEAGPRLSQDQTGNRLESHGSRGNFGDSRDYRNRDHGNRRGGLAFGVVALSLVLEVHLFAA